MAVKEALEEQAQSSEPDDNLRSKGRRGEAPEAETVGAELGRACMTARGRRREGNREEDIQETLLGTVRGEWAKTDCKQW